MINLEAEITRLQPERSLLFCYTASLLHFELFLLDKLQQEGAGQVTLVVDRHAYELTFAERTAVRGAGLDYQFAAIHLPGQYAAFHPKLYLFFHAAGASLFVASANLTLPGCRTNVEIVDRLALGAHGEGDTRAFGSFAEYLEGLVLLDPGLPERIQSEILEAAQWIRQRISQAPESGPHLLHTIERPLLDQLAALVPKEEVEEITIVSPFYDAGAEAIHALAKRYPSASLRVLRRKDPGDLSGSALQPLANRLQVENFRLQGKDKDRPLHAKLVHLRGNHRSWLVCGSANLSRPAWLAAAQAGGNVEAVTVHQGTGAAFSDLFDAVQSSETIDLADLTWLREEPYDRRERASDFRLVDIRDDGAQITVQIAFSHEEWAKADYEVQIEAAAVIPLRPSRQIEAGAGEWVTILEVGAIEEDVPLVVAVTGRLADGRTSSARGWLQRPRSLGRDADERAFRRSVRSLQIRGRMTEAGDLIVITDLLARLAAHLADMHSVPETTEQVRSGKPETGKREGLEHAISGITLGEGGASSRGGHLSEPALLLDRIIESIQRAWREEADERRESRGIVVAPGHSVDGAIEYAEEETRPTIPPLRTSDLAALLTRLEAASDSLFSTTPVAAAVPQAVRLLAALCQFAFELFLRLDPTERPQERSRARDILEHLLRDAFSIEGLGTGSPQGWMVEAWMDSAITPAVEDAWKGTNLSTSVATLLGALLALVDSPPSASPQRHRINEVAGMYIVFGSQRWSDPKWIGALREFAEALSALSPSAPAPETMVDAVVAVPLGAIPVLRELRTALPLLRKQGVDVPGFASADDAPLPAYYGKVERLLRRYPTSAIAPSLQGSSGVDCGGCFMALPTAEAAHLRSGRSHAQCTNCGRIVLPINFREPGVIRAIAALATTSSQDSE